MQRLSAQCVLLQAELRAAITIATPAEDLESYMTVWELQPFTDEDAVAALLNINNSDAIS